MVVPNYTYLKLKMPGPKGVITVGTTCQHACQCETESGDLAVIAAASHDLEVIQSGTLEVAPDANRSARSFKPTDGVKEIQLDPEGDKSKVTRVGVALTPK